MVHTQAARNQPERTAVSNDDSGWHRLGAALRQARIDSGYPRMEAFAEQCGVSIRVLSDLEAGRRTNFSSRVLGRLETGVGWPPGTMDQIVADPEFTPPGPEIGSDFLFRPPNYDRRPVPVDVAAVERAIAVLDGFTRKRSASRARKRGGDAVHDDSVVDQIGAALVALSWPYVIRLVEDNCLPSNALHPGVRPLYETFLAISGEFAPNDPSSRYAQWLAGDVTDVGETLRQRYTQRWTESRNVRRGRIADHTEAED